LAGAFRRRLNEGITSRYTNEQLAAAFRGVTELFPDKSFAASDEDRQTLRTWTQTMIGTYVSAIELYVPTNTDDGRVVIEPRAEQEVTMLKELTWFYVINNPSLATQQHGQRKIVKTLFNTFVEACTEPAKANFDLFLFS